MSRLTPTTDTRTICHYRLTSTSQLRRLFFFFNPTATTEIYTLSLHDALPIFPPVSTVSLGDLSRVRRSRPSTRRTDRKSTRLNSSHVEISYAVFCLKKKKRVKTNRVMERHMGALTMVTFDSADHTQSTPYLEM